MQIRVPAGRCADGIELCGNNGIMGERSIAGENQLQGQPSQTTHVAQHHDLTQTFTHTGSASHNVASGAKQVSTMDDMWARGSADMRRMRTLRKFYLFGPEPGASLDE